MHKIIGKNIDVSNDFIKVFESKSLHELLDYLILVFEPFHQDKFFDLEQSIIRMFESYKNGLINVSDARKLAFDIHRLAKSSQNDEAFYLRALGHMVSTLHVKTHALKALDYLIKVVYYQTKSNEQIVGERLRQMSLLFNQN